MNKINIALFFATLMVIGVCAEPRKLLTTKNVETRELQRILAELEEVHQLRERMLHDAAFHTDTGHMGAPAPAPGPAGGSGDGDDTDASGFDQTDAFNANN